MKKIFKYLMVGVVLVASSSCKKYLDINDNPNSFTSATPEIVLPQAIVGAASISNTFSNSFADFSGARANAGGFGGFGSVVTYDFSTSDYSGLWTATYDNANDFQYVINSTSGDVTLAYSTSVARIMKSFAFERLVNQFNDVPYSDALKGTASLQPKYDKAEDVYKACIADLTKAIADITTAQAATLPAAKVLAANSDPMFGGDMNRWKKFAQTVKLRMLIKMAGVPAQAGYATTQFATLSSAIGYLTADAIVQPGYERTTRPNPTYGSLGFSSTGTNVSTSRIPTKWILSFYNGIKLSDPFRGSLIYRSFPSTPTNQLGDESANVPKALAAGSAFTTGDKDASVLGVAKFATQGQPVILAAESNFLQAEAVVRGYISGNAATSYNDGILQSFTYLYKGADGKVDASKIPDWQIPDGLGGTKPDPTRSIPGDVANYMALNAGNPLVVYPMAGSVDQKIEAIITQKYIALNLISNDENFNEFRRTGFPKIVNGSLDPFLSFASRQSVSSHVDKLPTRVLYPQQEYNLNPTNAPAGINKFSSLIFWDLN